MLYTQNTRARTCSCSAACTVYSNFQSPDSLLFGSVYCILKMPGHGLVPTRQRILYTQNARARASFCSAAYTCILKFPEPRLAPARQRILYTQIPRTWAVSQMKAYTVYSKNQSSGLLLLDSVYCELRPITDRQLLDAQLYFLL